MQNVSSIKNAAQTVQAKRRKSRDRQISSKEIWSFAVVFRDKYTGWLDCYATGSKTAEDAMQALQHFVGPTEKVGLFYTDDAPELKLAAKA